MTWGRKIAVLVTAGVVGGALVIGAAPASAGDDGKRPKRGSSAAANVGTATITVDGTTFTAKAAKGGCELKKKLGKGPNAPFLPLRSFQGTGGNVDIGIVVDPGDPTTALTTLAIRPVSEGKEPWWDSDWRDASIAVSVEGRTTSGTVSLYRPETDPAVISKSVAEGKMPKDGPYAATFSFTC